MRVEKYYLIQLMKQIIQLLLRHIRKNTSKYSKYKYKSLHSLKSEGRQIRRLVKNIKGKKTVYKAIKRQQEKSYKMKK